MEELIVRIEWSGDNFTAYAEVNGVVFATSKKIEEMKSEFESVLQDHLQWSIDDGDDVEPFENYKLAYEYGANALLKYFEKTLTRSAISRYTGINQRQLGHYIQGVKKPRKSTEKNIIKGIRKIKEDLESFV